MERVEERWSGEAWLAGDEVGVGGLGRVPCPRDRLAVRGESVGGGDRGHFKALELLILNFPTGIRPVSVSEKKTRR